MSRSAKKNGLFLRYLAGCLSLGLLLLFLTDAQDFLTNQVSRPLEFKFRTWLNKSPKLDSRIKIYSFNDQTVDYLGYHDLTMDGWVRLIAHFSKSNPKAIYIDKLFGIPLQERVFDPLDPQKAQTYVDRLRALKVPIIIGGFVSPLQIPGRKMLSLFHEDYFVSQAEGTNKNSTHSEKVWPPIEQGYFYGPHPYIRDAFRVGHITNSEFGYSKPFFRLDPVSIVPHAAFLALGPLTVMDEKIFMDQQEIPLNSKNLIPINFSERQQYFSHTKSLKFSLDRIRQGVAEPDISTADIIVILPAMYTGNVDFKDTPVGRLQGGYFGVTLMNSVLQNLWVNESSLVNFCLVALSLALAMVLALLVQPMLAALGLLGLTTLLPLFGLLVFSYKGWSVAWLWASLSVAVAGFIVLIERLRADNFRSHALASSLRGALSPELADSIAQNPQLLHGDPVEQIVSIMFVDIVGFSLTTERLTAKEAFQQLKLQIEYIVDKVHQFDGLVDKSLGDGVLAFFGYHFGKDQIQVGHADQALLCAIEIQREALRLAEILKESGKPIFPLRIGINTATVYIGNLGTEGRIDFTLIGNGVNFTARLEHACPPYRIMLGLSTFDLLGQFTARDPGVTSKDIQIKHHKKPIPCFEYDPFHDQQHKVQAVLHYYMEYHKIYTNEPRWYLEPQDYLKVSTQFGDAWLVNFSVGGVALLFANALRPKQTIQVILLGGEEGKLPLAVLASICWTKELAPGKILLGCQFMDAPYESNELFIQGLRSAIQKLGKKLEVLPRNRPAA